MVEATAFTKVVPKTEAFCSFSREDGLISSQFYFNGASLTLGVGEIFERDKVVLDLRRPERAVER